MIKIMGNLPNTNLQDHAIRNTLNKGGGRTDNNFGSKFRSAAKPTIYAKFKGVKYPQMFVEDDNRWLGYNRYCGINIPNGFGSSGLDSIYNEEWNWDKPNGGESEPLRMCDWRGCNPDARTPLFQGRLKSKLEAYNGAIHVEAWVYHPNTTEGHLLVTDSEKLGDFRLGVRVKEPNGYIYIMTSDNTASEVCNDSGILQVNYPIEDDGGYDSAKVVSMIASNTEEVRLGVTEALDKLEIIKGKLSGITLASTEANVRDALMFIYKSLNEYVRDTE